MLNEVPNLDPNIDVGIGTFLSLGQRSNEKNDICEVQVLLSERCLANVCLQIQNNKGHGLVFYMAAIEYQIHT